MQKLVNNHTNNKTPMNPAQKCIASVYKNHLNKYVVYKSFHVIVIAHVVAPVKF